VTEGHKHRDDEDNAKFERNGSKEEITLD